MVTVRAGCVAVGVAGRAGDGGGDEVGGPLTAVGAVGGTPDVDELGVDAPDVEVTAEGDTDRLDEGARASPPVGDVAQPRSVAAMRQETSGRHPHVESRDPVGGGMPQP